MDIEFREMFYSFNIELGEVFIYLLLNWRGVLYFQYSVLNRRGVLLIHI